MNSDSERAGWLRRVRALLEKTVEKGATLGEEKSSVQHAYALLQQHGLDIDDFKARLALIGKPPRYVVTDDGFLVPAAAGEASEQPTRQWDGRDRRRSPPPLRRIDELLNRTIENGATPGEEKTAVQLAYQLTRQHHLDIESFKARLRMIGSPQRYMLTGDGFLVPFATVQADAPRTWDGRERRRRSHGGAESPRQAAYECPSSPTGQHRWVPFMRGTFPTGIENCVHCGARKQ